jgi:hypothetical protein
LSGVDWEDSRVLASADQAVDENVFTRPTVQVAPGAPSGIEQPRQKPYLFNSLSVGLSLQDYALHCFSRNKDERGVRDPSVLSNLGRLENAANLRIDQAKSASRPADITRAIITIGVYLHCQQDSWAHSGYGGNPMGHAEDGHAPDHPAQYPSNTRDALKETIQKIHTFFQRWDRSLRDISDANFEELLALLTDKTSLSTAADSPEAASTHKAFNQPSDFSDRPQCNQALMEYWLANRTELGKSLIANGKSPTMITIHPKVREEHVFRDSIVYSDRVSVAPDVVSYRCELRLRRLFSEIGSLYKEKHYWSGLDGTLTIWSDPVTLSFITLAQPKYPVLDAELIWSASIDKVTGSYEVLDAHPK